MSLFQSTVETYDAHKSLVGVMQEGHDVPLAPVAHQTTTAQICITLDKDGNFISAEKMDEKIIIPVTEESAGRSGLTIRPHPLCDQLSYLYPNKKDERYAVYLEQLREWNVSAYMHPKLKPILSYVEKGIILTDLSKAGIIKLKDSGEPEKEKDVVCWRVIDGDEAEWNCWTDVSLFNAFMGYYLKKKEENCGALCLVSGKWTSPANQHPKGVSAINGNAKLISANDTSGFTFRGRFFEDTQAASVSYEVSQKAHNALRWLIADQGVSIEGRTFLCWNPQGFCTPGIVGNFRKQKQEEIIVSPSNYRESLLRSLMSYKSELPDTAKVVIAVFDAATSGRLAVTYYKELRGSDFLQRLHDWESGCCWNNGPFGIQSPSLYQIANTAFGTKRVEGEREFWEADKRVFKQQVQRLVACRVDSGRLPTDIAKALVDRSSNAHACSISLWRKTVFITCAVLNKYLIERKGIDVMSWDLETCDRSFQYGRLLAVMERAELDYYKKTNEDRQTNAIKSLSAFRRRPFTVYARVDEHLRTAYLPRMELWARQRYLTLKEDIVKRISTFPENDLNKPLDDIYLLGYDLQRAAFFKSTDKENEQIIDNESKEA